MEHVRPDTVSREVPIAALKCAVHSFTSAESRWKKRLSKGMTDEEVKDALKKEFGIWGDSPVRGLDPWRHKHAGEGDPTLTVYFGFERVETRLEATFKGKRLIELAREALGIPQHGGSIQRSLF